MARKIGSKNKKPAVGRTYTRSLTIAGHIKEIEELRKIAKASGKSASRFIIETILGK